MFLHCLCRVLSNGCQVVKPKYAIEDDLSITLHYCISFQLQMEILFSYIFFRIIESISRENLIRFLMCILRSQYHFSKKQTISSPILLKNSYLKQYIFFFKMQIEAELIDTYC